MIWFLVLVMIILMVLLIVKWNNFYGLVFALGLLTIEILIFVIVLSTAKFSAYPNSTHLEYRVYYALLKVKLNVFDLKRIANISIWLFSVVMLLIAWKNSIVLHKGRMLLAYGAFFVVLSVWFLGLDSVRMHEWIYIRAHMRSERVLILKKIIQWGELFWVIVCSVLPLWKIGYLIRDTRLLVRKRYLCAVLISTGILAAIYLLILLNAPMKYYLWEYEANNFRNLYGFYQKSTLMSAFLWLFLLVVVIILLLVRFDILKEKSFVRKKWSYRNSLIRINDLRHVFHSYKNAMFSIECMCDVVLEKYGEPESEQAAREILACARSYRQQAGRFLSVYNRTDMRWNRFQMQEAVGEARRRVGSASGIELVVCIETEDDFIYGDFESMVEMFINLINNSREAIQKKNGGEGEIRVTVWSESMLVCVSVRDNGEGMDKKCLKNLYTPFYTTKKNFHNWGIGMSQIRKTVDSHRGFIEVESRVGRYTEIQIAVPLDV